jgi:hypothetical protein
LGKTSRSSHIVWPNSDPDRRREFLDFNEER